MKFFKHRITTALHPQGKDGKQFIRIRVTFNSSRLDLYSGISLNSDQWDNKHKRVKQGCAVDSTPYNILNKVIDEQISFINDYFNGCSLRDATPSLSDLKERFNKQFKRSNEAKSGEFFHLFDSFIAEKSAERGWGKDMNDVYDRLRNKIREFKCDMTFADLSIATMNNLTRSLSKTMYNDALGKMLTYFRGFVLWAKGKKYEINEEFFAYNPKLPKAKKDVRYLDTEDVVKICEIPLENDSALDRVRDMFVFQCYTALRFSDLKQLKSENITQDKDGTYHLDILTEKNDKRIKFPLAKRATDIYVKYRERQYSNGLLFPVISNQKYNKHLKELGKRAELKGEWIDYEYRLSEKIVIKTPKEELSTHTARRTFVVTAINEGIDPTLIAIVTSHSDLKSMMPYITKNSKGAKKVIDAINKAEENANK